MVKVFTLTLLKLLLLQQLSSASQVQNYLNETGSNFSEEKTSPFPFLDINHSSSTDGATTDRSDGDTKLKTGSLANFGSNSAEGSFFSSENSVVAEITPSPTLITSVVDPLTPYDFIEHKIKSALGLKGEKYEYPYYTGPEFLFQLADNEEAQKLSLEQHLQIFFSTGRALGSVTFPAFEEYWEYIRDVRGLTELSIDQIFHFITVALNQFQATPEILTALLEASGYALPYTQQTEIYRIFITQCRYYDTVSHPRNPFTKALFRYQLQVITSLLKYYDTFVVFDGFCQNPSMESGMFWLIPQLAPILKALWGEPVDSIEYSSILAHSLETGDKLQIIGFSLGHFAALDLIFQEVFAHHAHADFSAMPYVTQSIKNIIKSFCPQNGMASFIEYCVENKFKYLLDAIFFTWAGGDDGAPLDCFEFFDMMQERSMNSKIALSALYLAYFDVSYDTFDKFLRDYLNADDDTLALLEVLLIGADSIPSDGTKMTTFEPTEQFLTACAKAPLYYPVPVLMELGRVFLTRQTRNPFSCFSYATDIYDSFEFTDMLHFINLSLNFLGKGSFEVEQGNLPFVDTVAPVGSQYLKQNYQVGPFSIPKKESKIRKFDFDSKTQSVDITKFQ